jgi:uncharacterized protein
MARLLFVVISVAALATPAAGQDDRPRPPVIDMHVHSTNTSPQEQLDRMRSLNIRHAWVAALAVDLPTWTTDLPEGHFLPALSFPCVAGRAPFVPRRCWEGVSDFPDTLWLRHELRAGRIKGFGELVPQLIGIAPNDPRLDVYWAMAEEFDIPVAIHMGPAPPGAAYESNPSPFSFPEYRVAANDPLLLEEILLRHKGLRLLVMHAGWPFLDATLAVLYAHPNVYVDVGALQAEFMVPRVSYYRHLRGLVEGGFGKRIVFGSDFPNGVATGIDAILAADFLSNDQKADILCGNAARFLRLEGSVCAP